MGGYLSWWLQTLTGEHLAACPAQWIEAKELCSREDQASHGLAHSLCMANKQVFDVNLVLTDKEQSGAWAAHRLSCIFCFIASLLHCLLHILMFYDV